MIKGGEKKKKKYNIFLEEHPCLSISTYNTYNQHLKLLKLEVVQLFIAAISGKGSLTYFYAK